VSSPVRVSVALPQPLAAVPKKNAAMKQMTAENEEASCGTIKARKAHHAEYLSKNHKYIAAHAAIFS
jgi:hypothetical protein